ncbi:MAG: signal peptidase I [Treponema sp.]|nr:signal peptidase I [Treponema sp.]
MLKPVFLALVIALVLKLFLFDLIIAQGHSMEPAIKNGDVLVVSRLRYGMRLPFQKDYIFHWALPKTGEVVIFYTPSGEIAVKRCTDLIDGAQQKQRARFYAVGDNSLDSFDSRSYGSVPVKNIIGKVLGF